MKKINEIILGLIVTLFVVMSLFVGFLVFKKKNQETKEQTELASIDIGVRSFEDWSEYEEFKMVPAMLVDGSRIGRATDYGDETYIIDVQNTDFSDYQEYLALLEKTGFVKYVDNGEKGLDEAVYTATYTKDGLVVTVTYVVNIKRTYIAANQDLPLSEHLHYQDTYVEDNAEGAQTTFHMLELFDFGNSFVIQLKNGHFIINDGGLAEDGIYLLDYLEHLTPEGEKPVVEMWLISHAHGDHMQGVRSIASSTENASRIYVEGFYFCEPSDTVCGAYDPTARSMIESFNLSPLSFRTTKGDNPKIYRPQTGQRYYFNDITVDILNCQEQLYLTNYSGDFNDTSTTVMYTIENQKVLITGDCEIGGMKNIMRTYSQEYLTLDMFQAVHHSLNTDNEFTDYITVKTVIAAGDKLADTKENAYLAEKASEVYGWGEGTVIFTFPYKVGTAQVCEKNEWKYHPLRGLEEAKK